MKRIVFTLMAVALMTGSANAAYWQLDATFNTQYSFVPWSNFSIVFNDADLSGSVTVDEIYSFSGVIKDPNLSNEYFYDSVRGLPSMKVGGLTLVLNAGDNWNFKKIGGADTAVNERYWFYSVAEIPAPTTPIPGAVWLLGTGVAGLFGLRRKFL